MSNVVALPKLKSRSIEAVVIRADGTREDLGVVSYQHSNPLKTFAWYLIRPKHWSHKAGKFLRLIGVK